MRCWFQIKQLNVCSCCRPSMIPIFHHQLKTLPFSHFSITRTTHSNPFWKSSHSVQSLSNGLVHTITSGAHRPPRRLAPILKIVKIEGTKPSTSPLILNINSYLLICFLLKVKLNSLYPSENTELGPRWAARFRSETLKYLMSLA